MSDPSRKTSFRGYWPGLAVMVSLCAALMFLMIYGGRDKAKINVDLTQSGVKIGGGITLEDRDYYALIGDRKVFIKSWLNKQQLNVLDIVAGDPNAI